MQVAVIGLGDIARKAYLPILSEQAGLDLILFSRSAASVEQVQGQYRIPLKANSLEQVIQSRPAAAFVLTPRETHFEIIRRLLTADIDVFVEKPATLQAEQTEQLADLADRRGRVLMVGFNRRFAPLHIKARDLMEGHPVSVALFQKHRKNSRGSGLQEQLIEDTIHQIDLVRFYCGEGKALSSVEDFRDGHLLGAVSTIRLESGGIAVISISLQAGAWSETYSLHGTDQSLLVDAFSRARLITPTGDQSWDETYASSWRTTLEGRGFKGEVDHFFECVSSRSQPLTSAWQSVRTQQLLEQLVAVSGSKGS